VNFRRRNFFEKKSA